MCRYVGRKERKEVIARLLTVHTFSADHKPQRLALPWFPLARQLLALNHCCPREASSAATPSPSQVSETESTKAEFGVRWSAKLT